MEVGNVSEFIRQTLMNTAQPVCESNSEVMASVRQVGAGMVNVEKAVQNKVLVSYHGKAAVELYDELGTVTAGQLLLTNYGDEAVTYTLTATSVYTDTTLRMPKHSCITMWCWRAPASRLILLL